jgi:hypothetical protein
MTTFKIRAGTISSAIAFVSVILAACVSNTDREDTGLASSELTADAGSAKVTLCHLPPGNPANMQLITVGASAVPAHKAHGDGVCASGATDCCLESGPTSLCTNLKADTANCGACGTACFSGQLCTAGACVCPTGQSLCGKACVTESSDPNNCGACGVVCPSAQSCVGGACVCPTGQSLCGSGSADGGQPLPSCPATLADVPRTALGLQSGSSGTGLHAEYDGTTLDGEAPIDHGGVGDGAGGLATLYQGVVSNGTAPVLWQSLWNLGGETLSGFIQGPRTGSVTFDLTADDLGTLSIGNGLVSLVVDNTWDSSVTVQLQAGVWYPITISYQNRTGSNRLALYWACPVE